MSASVSFGRRFLSGSRPRVAAVLLGFAVMASADAATRTWTGGGGNNNIGTALNWGGTAPLANDDLIFTGSLRLTPSLAATLTANSVAFASGAGAFTISGLALTLGTGGLTNNSTNTQTISAAIVLGAAQSWTANTGALTVSGGITNAGFTLTSAGSSNSTLSGVIAGLGGLTKSGSGTLTISGASANTFTGLTSVNDGTLLLNKTAGLNAFAGGLTVGDGAGAANSAVTRWLAANEMPGQTLSVNSDGLADLNGFSDAIGAVTITGGTITTGAGTLTLGGNVTTNASATVATIGGNLALGANRSFTVANGGAAVDLQVGAVLSGAFTVTKMGTGTMVFSGANTYTGLTSVTAGVLNIQNALALGTTAGATTVTSGAALQLQGDIAVGTEALSLSGSGVANDGVLRNISGTNSFGGAITLLANSTIGVDAGSLALSGVISGAFNLTKVGAGTLTLSASNLFSGAVAIQNGTISVVGSGLGTATSAVTLGATGTTGTLQYTGATASSTRPFVLASGGGGGIDVYSAGTTLTLATGASISGSGNFEKSGAGTLVLTAANTFTGNTTISAGTLRLGGNDRLSTTGSLTITGGTFDLSTFSQTVNTLTVSGGATVTGTGTLTSSAGVYALQNGTVNANLAGSGTMTKSTLGTILLNLASNYTGLTSVDAGTLQVNASGALGTILNGTTVASGAALKLNGVNYAIAEALSINGTGVSNSGALVNVGTSTYAGLITAATNATINAGGGTLNLTGGVVKNGTVLTIAGGGTVNISGAGISGSLANSDLVVDGTTVVLNAANTYNGPTTIQNSGTLQLGANNVLPASPQTAMTINTSSVLNMAGHNDSVASLAGDSTAVVKNSTTNITSILTVNPTTGVATTFSGVIAGTNSGTQGDMALVKSGAGSLTLTGANTFSGTTTVSGGTLTAAANSGSALASTSSLTVNTGGTLLLGASNQINDSATMTLAGGTFVKGDFSEGSNATAGVGALTLTATGSHLDFGAGTTGTLTFSSFTPGSFKLTIDNWSGTANTLGSPSTDRLIFNTDQTANLASFAFTGYLDGARQFDLGGGYYEVTPTAVPEPSTYVAAAFSALAAVTVVLRRRKRVARCATA